MNYSAQFVDGVLLGFDGENEAPFLSQPCWPDGTPWANEAEALEFFEVLTTSFTDPTAPLVGDNSSNHPQARIEPEALPE
jgi:hypothetical protein